MTKAISYYIYYSHVYLTMDKKYGDSIKLIKHLTIRVIQSLI